MKKLRILGKEFPVILVASVLLASFGSAAVLTYYGQITATVVAQQSILLDGQSYPASMQVTDTISEPAPGGEKFCNMHTLKNQMSVAGNVKLVTTVLPDPAGITTTYGTTVTDSTTNFGNVKNEVCGELELNQVTLNQVFAGNGLTYQYTVVAGGTYNGASPIIAVLNLADGRHILLYPGWATRTGSESLQFSDTVATSTADSGNVPVDFTIYNSAWTQTWSSNNQYGNWNFLKSTGSTTGGALPLTGNEYVTSITFMTQAANTGETDTLNGFSYDSVTLNFNNAIVDNTPFAIPSGQELAFCLCHSFAQNIVPGTYTITTSVAP